MFFRRMRGDSILTRDPILLAYRFTNAYRASDRVSQYLIRHVIDEASPEDLFLRIIVFKLFNKIETWEVLEQSLGRICVDTFEVREYDRILSERLAKGERIYSSAYIMPCPRLGFAQKHSNHLALVQRMLRENLGSRLAEMRQFRDVYEHLLSYPSIGPFLAFQFSIDCNYSSLFNFSEMDFVIAGPGARDGIRKCFEDSGGLDDEDIIRFMAERAAAEFDRLEISFLDLFRRPLHLIDYQNIFCEVGKYARVAHPKIPGASGRTRIKQRYRRNPARLEAMYPRKWRIDASVTPPSPPQIL